MLSLFIMRHANSDWSDIKASDFNRSICKNIKELELLSNKIKELKIEFDLIFTHQLKEQYKPRYSKKT